MRLVCGSSHSEHQRIALWVGKRIPFVGDAGFGNSVGVMVVSKSNAPLAGVVFHDWQPRFGTMAFSIAADSPKWATHGVVGSLLAYPFEQAGVEKLWTATPSTNSRALKLVKALPGFKQEGILSRHFGQYGHAVISRIFKADYVRFYGEKHGKAQSADAA